MLLPVALVATLHHCTTTTTTTATVPLVVVFAGGTGSTAFTDALNNHPQIKMLLGQAPTTTALDAYGIEPLDVLHEMTTKFGLNPDVPARWLESFLSLDPFGAQSQQNAKWIHKEVQSLITYRCGTRAEKKIAASSCDAEEEEEAPDVQSSCLNTERFARTAYLNESCYDDCARPPPEVRIVGMKVRGFVLSAVRKALKVPIGSNSKPYFMLLTRSNHVKCALSEFRRARQNLGHFDTAANNINVSTMVPPEALFDLTVRKAREAVRNKRFMQSIGARYMIIDYEQLESSWPAVTATLRISNTPWKTRFKKSTSPFLCKALTNLEEVCA